jgi:hypothetical protein
MSLLAATNPQKKKTEMSVAKALLFFIGWFDSCKIEKALACTKAEKEFAAGYVIGDK